MGDVYRIPYAYCYRCSYNLTYPSCGMTCAHALEDAFKRLVPADSVAAVIVEPILGEGGFVTPPKEFFGTLCRKFAASTGLCLLRMKCRRGSDGRGNFLRLSIMEWSRI